MTPTGPLARLGGRAGLISAAVIAAVLLAGGAVLRIAPDLSGSAPLLDRLIPVLTGTAFLLVGLLALPRLPGLAWASVVLAASAGALEMAAAVRTLEAFAAGAAWRDLALIGGLAMVGAVVVATAFAGRDWSRASIVGRVAFGFVALGAIATIGAALWAVLVAEEVALPTGDAVTITPIRAAARIALATIAGGFVVGVARGLGPAAMRASYRSRAEPVARPGGALWRYLGLVTDEVLPSRSDARREAAEAERARLAADLHAHVLPDLRRAAAAAESAGLPSEVQVDLRRALEDVEQLMHERQSIVLEQFGLVAALEWLAERAEERSALRVELELVGAVPDGASSIDARVARAAYRIALLGLDNVVRHADATTATVRLSGDALELRMTIEDDGATPTFDGSGGRGIPDMRTAAAESGGSVAFLAGTGARIEATWPLARAARNHAPGRAPIADRPEAPAP